MLAFAILTKLPDELNSLIEKVTLNTKTQGSPGAILNLLHDAEMKEESLKTFSKNDMEIGMALNREVFKSKTINYCRNGQHNPLANNPLTNDGNSILKAALTGITRRKKEIIPLCDLCCP
ncbi:hypothetical protein O181_097454 [Austropuccinia psidii MF-1]|uniref:Uncharacterized protein n=1 Tax=Austropuccinia psidii MF-1 TaxID=1389203 RepID=A0A9Q3J9A8_9BASI|nr:hypothetical protein [Austropuccinia psidii MF-1]